MKTQHIFLEIRHILCTVFIIDCYIWPNYKKLFLFNFYQLLISFFSTHYERKKSCYKISERFKVAYSAITVNPKIDLPKSCPVQNLFDRASTCDRQGIKEHIMMQFMTSSPETYKIR